MDKLSAMQQQGQATGAKEPTLKMSLGLPLSMLAPPGANVPPTPQQQREAGSPDAAAMLRAMAASGAMPR